MPGVDMTEGQFRELFDAVSNWGRWEFMFVAAPLRVPGGTGSPLNPLAVF